MNSIEFAQKLWRQLDIDERDILLEAAKGDRTVSGHLIDSVAASLMQRGMIVPRISFGAYELTQDAFLLTMWINQYGEGKPQRRVVNENVQVGDVVVPWVNGARAKCSTTVTQVVVKATHFDMMHYGGIWCGDRFYAIDSNGRVGLRSPEGLRIFAQPGRFVYFPEG